MVGLYRDVFAIAAQRYDKAVGAAHLDDFGFKPKFRARLFRLSDQHIHDVFGGIIAEQLAERLFMPADAISADQPDEVPRRIAGEGGFAEVGVLAEEVLSRHLHIREIAASTARNADLFARTFRVVDNQYITTRMGSAEQAGSTGAKDERTNLHVPSLTAFD